MRMRKKKYLSERMDRCKDYIINTENIDKNPNQSQLDIEYIDFEKVFGNDKPLILEIGCGKGMFIVKMAKLFPEFNFLGVEVSENVIVSACEKAVDENLDNVMFFNCGGEYLQRFIKDNSIDRIYLNFSTPYPKSKNANRRLTYPRYLEIYKSILKPNGEVHQKTDSMSLFEYSLEQFSQNGFALKNISLDLQNSGFDNIMTEYETKFVSLGKPIYRLEAYLKE